MVNSYFVNQIETIQSRVRIERSLLSLVYQLLCSIACLALTPSTSIMLIEGDGALTYWVRD